MFANTVSTTPVAAFHPADNTVLGNMSQEKVLEREESQKYKRERKRPARDVNKTHKNSQREREKREEREEKRERREREEREREERRTWQLFISNSSFIYSSGWQVSADGCLFFWLHVGSEHTLNWRQ